MLKVAVSFLLCITMLNAFDCEKAGNMSEIKDCSYREFKLEDKELNVLYKRVMEELDYKRKQKLKIAQRAWIVYRDAEAEFTEDHARGGSLAGYLYSKSRIKSTKNRIIVLQEALLEWDKE